MDLDQFHETFFEESFEALDSMEAALLTFDVGSPDPESINTVFRVAHSIKGGAGMFGFTDVTEFTHVLETLLDKLRSGKLEVTASMSDDLLQSVDVMRALLQATQTGQETDKAQVDALRQRLEAASAAVKAGSAGAAASSSSDASARESTPFTSAPVFARGRATATEARRVPRTPAGRRRARAASRR